MSFDEEYKKYKNEIDNFLSKFVLTASRGALDNLEKCEFD